MSNPGWPQLTRLMDGRVPPRRPTASANVMWEKLRHPAGEGERRVRSKARERFVRAVSANAPKGLQPGQGGAPERAVVRRVPLRPRL